MAKEPSTSAKETYLSAKEPYVFANIYFSLSHSLSLTHPPAHPSSSSEVRKWQKSPVLPPISLSLSLPPSFSYPPTCPIFPPKSPALTQKSPIFPPTALSFSLPPSFCYPPTCPKFPPKSPALSQKSPIFPTLSLSHQRALH